MDALGHDLPEEIKWRILSFEQHPVAALIKDLDFRRGPALDRMGDLVVTCPDDERHITFYKIRKLTGYTFQGRDLRIRYTSQYHATPLALWQEEQHRYYYRRYIGTVR